LDVDSIYSKIAPYLERPEFIKQFLDTHSEKTKEELIKIIESELNETDAIQRTDLRILLNSISES
jgi:hypothetical protein